MDVTGWFLLMVALSTLSLVLLMLLRGRRGAKISYKYLPVGVLIVVAYYVIRRIVLG